MHAIESPDVMVIGSGAGGASVARTLGEAGRRVLLLERGDHVPQEDANWSPDDVVLDGRYQTDERWDDAARGDDLSPQAYYRVGGNTKFYGGLLHRMREADFGELRHAEGLSPGWPVGYAEMEPYYARAEAWYTIHGDASGDPTEPWRSTPCPFPPFEHEPRIQECADRLRGLGLHPSYASLCLDTRGAGGQGRCVRCATCDPFPCKLHAKRDAETAGVIPALATGNVQLLTGVRARRLIPAADGKSVAAVEVEANGERRRLSAPAIVLSAGAVNSAALLLHSANAAWPDGCANASGKVGRGLMKHNHSGIVAVSDAPNPTVFQKTLCFNDYYFGSAAHGIDHPLGSIQMTGKAPWQRLQQWSGRDMPRAVLEDLAAHSVDWWLTGEDLPDDDNRVTVTGDGRPRIHFTPNNRGPHRRLLQIWQDHLRDIGFHQFWVKTMGREVVWHQAGTCRMGDDPAASVLDRGCRAHDLDNLYVVDASFMPSMGATNPTLTIIANAIRVAEGMLSGN